MDDDFFRDIDSRGRDNLFLWTVLILLLIGFAMACWLGTYYIFGHPENPRSYRILKKLKKVDPPKRFEVTAAPPGEFRSARQLYDKYITYSRLQLEQENSSLIQNYIYNYQSTKLLVPYITGRFTILDSYELRKTDMFSPGVVALAQASDFPQVLIEYVYTSPEATVPLLDQMLHTGLDIKLERTLDLSAIIHIAKVYDGRLQFTVVPLLYGSYALKQATGSFSLEPPADLNMDAGVPIIRTALLQEAFRSYAEFKRNSEPIHAAPKLAFSSSPTPTPTPVNTELVRVETPTPSPTPTPVVIATPTPTPGLIASLLQPKPRPKHSPTPTPARLAALSSTPRPAPPPPTPSLSLPRVSPSVSVLPRSTPAATPPRSVSPEGVPLQPFLVAAPTPNTTTDNIGSWRTFPPGQLPRGRLIDVQQAEALTDAGIGAEHVYLRGSFVVTASGEGRAVLRTHNASGPNLVPFNSSGAGSPRVIVEFPAGTVPPGEGQTFSRDEYRPFQVTQVRRGGDGQINIYVREITTPN